MMGVVFNPVSSVAAYAPPQASTSYPGLPQRLFSDPKNIGFQSDKFVRGAFSSRMSHTTYHFKFWSVFNFEPQSSYFQSDKLRGGSGREPFMGFFGDL